MVAGKNMKKKRFLIYFSICLSLVVLLGVSFFYLRKLNALEKNIERVGYSYQVIIQTSLLEKILKNAETCQRGYILTASPDFLESYLKELRNIPGILIHLDKLTTGNAYQQRNLDTLRHLLNEQLLVLKNNMENGIEDTLLTTRFDESNIHMNAITGIINNIEQNETKLLSERNYTTNKNTTESRRSSFLSLTIAFCLCCAAAGSVLWFFNKNEIYRRELEDKLSKLTILNEEIKSLTLASTHNLQEPMRKVQTIIDRVQHISKSGDKVLESSLNRIKEIYNKQQTTNNTIIEYYNLLSGPNEMATIDLREFILDLKQENVWNYPLNLQVGDLQKIKADPSQLRSLFVHIVNNCIQFRHPERDLIVQVNGTRNPSTIASTKNYYCICVSDNGIGIDDEYRTKIFDLFEKIENSVSGSFQSGMGLSFCKRIMRNHSGWISAEKNPQFGTNISLYFQLPS